RRSRTVRRDLPHSRLLRLRFAASGHRGPVPAGGRRAVLGGGRLFPARRFTAGRRRLVLREGGLRVGGRIGRRGIGGGLTGLGGAGGGLRSRVRRCGRSPLAQGGLAEVDAGRAV